MEKSIIRERLNTQKQDVLVNIIVEQAEDDERLFRQLYMKAARSKACDVKVYREALEIAVHIDGFVSYLETYDYASGIEDVLDSIEELLDDNRALEVVELVDYALNAVEKALNCVDGSSGTVGGILCRLQDIHLEACKKSAIDPEELATQLFDWELRTDFDTFYGATQIYANILGKKGLTKYRELAKVPGSDSKERYGRRFRITRIMESIAKESRDVEAVIAIKIKDLSTSWNYFQIAETYKEAGKDDQALQWAEKGAEAFPDRTDSRLRAFLIEEYFNRKRYEEMMAVAWQEFNESLNLAQYRNLEKYSSKIDQWSSCRTKALDLIRNIIEQENSQESRRYSCSYNQRNSLLVQIFLWENDVEAAWMEAVEGGCTDSL